MREALFFSRPNGRRGAQSSPVAASRSPCWRWPKAASKRGATPAAKRRYMSRRTPFGTPGVAEDTMTYKLGRDRDGCVGRPPRRPGRLAPGVDDAPQQVVRELCEAERRQPKLAHDGRAAGAADGAVEVDRLAGRRRARSPFPLFFARRGNRGHGGEKTAVLEPRDRRRCGRHRSLRIAQRASQ